MKVVSAALIMLLLIGCATQDPVLDKQVSEKPTSTTCWDGNIAAKPELCPPVPPPFDAGCSLCPDATCLDSITNDPKDAGICTPPPSPPAPTQSITCWEGSVAATLEQCPPSERPVQPICPDGRVVNWAAQCRSVEDTGLENGNAACTELGLKFDAQTDKCG